MNILENFQKLCFALAPIMMIAVADHPNPDFRVVKSAYFRKRDHIIPYETTAKVFFRVELPSLNTTGPKNCTTNDVLCKATQTLYQTYDSNSQVIQALALNNSRQDRQLGIIAAAAGGYYLSSMISKFSKKIFGSETDVSADIDKMRRAMQHNNKEFLLFETSVHKYAVEMTSTVTSIKSKQDSILVALNILSAIDLIEMKFRNIEIGLQSCINGYIPFTLIDSDVLRKSLHDISGKVHDHGLKLAVSSRSIGEYYKMEIADCVVTKTAITVLANIPLSTQSWKIIDVLPLPFSYGNHTCQLRVPRDTTVATGKNFILMDSYAMEFCGSKSGQLCFVPSLKRSASALTDCIRSMYKGVRSESSLSHCPMDCDQKSETTIIELSPATIVATNILSVHVKCPYREQEYSIDSMGAVEVNLRCHCTYTVGNYSISSSLACAQGEHIFTDVTSIVPDVWTTFQYSQDFILRSELKQTILNSQLELHLPIEQSDLQVPFFTYNFDLTGVLLVAVIILVIILAIALGFSARSHWKMMKI